MRSDYPIIGKASVTNIIFTINKLKMVKSMLQQNIKLCNLSVDYYNLQAIILK